MTALRHLLRFLRDVRTGHDDLMALADATADPRPDDNGSAATRPAAEGVDVLDPAVEVDDEGQECDRTFHALISELIEGLAAVRAPLHDEDFAEWHRELAWTGDDA